MNVRVLSGGGSLLFLYEEARPFDVLSVLRQTEGRKFDPDLFLGTAERCRFGCPRVIVCSPLRALAPFPTSFWLTCPRLVRQAGVIESGGGVGDLERWIETRAPHEWIPFNVKHRQIRLKLLSQASLDFLRRFKPEILDRLRSGGVGGIQYDAGTHAVHVKCVHLQAASWLALGHHPGEEWLEAQGAGEDCRGELRDFCAGPAEPDEAEAGLVPRAGRKNGVQ